MASATMGLRRRVPVNNSPTPSGQSVSASSGSSKRSRSENNNSPSHGNLNSMNASRDEPPTKKSRGTSTSATKAASSASSNSSSPEVSPSSKSRGGSVSRSAQAKTSTPPGSGADASTNGALSASWPAQPNMSDMSTYASVPGLGMAASPNAGLCAGSLSMPTPIPYMSSSMATFVGNATNLGKSSSVSYLDISNMTGGSLSSSAAGLNSGYVAGNGNAGNGIDSKTGVPIPFPGIASGVNGDYGMQKGQPENVSLPKKFQSDGMFNAYQPWVIKTYGDLAKTKTITIKKYARILRTLRGEEVNSAENSKFRFWVKSKGFHIGQPEGYDAKPADRIIGRHAVTSPGLDPPLYVPTQLPHNKALNGAEGTVPPGRVYKKVAIVENFFDIIHAVHVDLEGRPGKHAGQKRTYRTITETYAFLPREAVTRFLLGCTECQRRPRTPSPTNISNQTQQSNAATALTTTQTPLSPSTAGGLTTASTTSSSSQGGSKSRDGGHQPGETKALYSYRHQKHHKSNASVSTTTAATTTTTMSTTMTTTTTTSTTEKPEKEKEEKYNPLSITNLLKKEPVTGGFLPSADRAEALPESRRTPESDRASSRSSASSKRKRMLPEGRTPSPQPSQPLPRPWSPGLDPKNTPIDYSLPITTSYLKHQQRLLQAEKNKAAAIKESEIEQKVTVLPAEEIDSVERERYSPATGLIDTNLNLLATIQHLHCQVMLALTERLRPSITMPSPLVLPTAANILTSGMIIGSEVSVQTGEHHT
nr:mucin-17-like [Megalopta genalis]XP_033333983.1 mucin-17-like [Megalopta genalis]XP_033333985.1 mucin-17-like [Megalopta genalis]